MSTVDPTLFERTRSAALLSLLENDGFVFIPDSIPLSLLRELKDECLDARNSSLRAEGQGELQYRSSLAPLGMKGRELLENAASSEILEPLFGRKFSCSWNASCYTYYEAGDFLAAHLDGVENCEVTLLFYLDATTPGNDPGESGLHLTLYRQDEGGAVVPRKTIATTAGGIMLGFGSRVLHGRRRLEEGEHIFMLTACFTSAPA